MVLEWKLGYGRMQVEGRDRIGVGWNGDEG